MSLKQCCTFSSLCCGYAELLQHFVTALTSSRPGSEVRGHVTAVEGQAVTIGCSFRVLFARQSTRVYKFRWLLNGLTLSSSRRITITSARQADERAFFISTLTFDPVIRAFSGQVNYFVFVINHQGRHFRLMFVANPFPPLCLLFCPLFFHLLSLFLLFFPSYPSSAHSPPRSGPLNPARGLGERCKLPRRVRAEPCRQTVFMHLKTKLAHSVNYILLHFDAATE